MKILLIVNKNLREEDVKTVQGWTEELLKSYGVENPVFERREVEEDDFGQIEDTLRSNISRLKQEGLVPVDITPGRKYMSAITMHCGLAGDVFIFITCTSRILNIRIPLFLSSR